MTIPPGLLYQQLTSPQEMQNYLARLFKIRQAGIQDMMTAYKSYSNTGTIPDWGATNSAKLLGQDPAQPTDSSPGSPAFQQGMAAPSQGADPLGQTPYPQNSALGMFGPPNTPTMSSRQVQEQHLVDDLDKMSPDEMQSRAQALGIHDPASLPTDILKHAILNQRIIQRGASQSMDVTGALGDASVAEVGIGATRALAGLSRQLARSLPFIGDDLDQALGQHTTEDWLAKLDEGVRANIGQRDQWGASLAAGAGSFLGYSAAFEVGYKALAGSMLSAGASFPAIGSIAGNAMARGAIAATGTSLLLEAGSGNDWLPSMSDVMKVFSGDSDFAERAGASYRLLMGNRVMNASLAALMGGLGERAVESYGLKNYHRRLDEFGAVQQSQQIMQQSIGGGQQMALGPGQPPPNPGPRPVFTVDNQGVVTPDYGPQQGPGIPTSGMQQQPITDPLRQLGPGEQTIWQQGMPDQNTPPPSQPSQPQLQLTGPRRGPNTDRTFSSTPADAAEPIVRLRQQYNEMIDSGHATEQELSSVEDQIFGWMDAAGIPRRKEPTIWTVLKDNPRSPATPTRDIVEQYGTSFRTPSGQPKLMYHGSGVGYDNPDIAKVMANPESQLVGPGWYWTENPVIAGGDLSGVTDEAGYAGGRAGSIQAERADLQIQLGDMQKATAAFESSGPQSGITPDAYSSIQRMMPTLQQRLNDLPEPQPNVRAAFLAVKNPFRYDEPIETEKAMQILAAAQEKYPGYDWSNIAPDLQNKGNTGQLFGRDVYSAISNTEPLEELKAGWEGTPTSMSDDGAEFHIGKSRTNDLLKDLGHDGITYRGGLRLGNNLGSFGEHDAVNVFDPSNVVPAFLDQPNTEMAARALGQQQAKAYHVGNSPATADLASHSQLTDADVIQAMASSKPGGMHILKGVDDPQKLFEGLARQQYQGASDPLSAMIKSFRPVINPKTGKLDVLVSSLGDISDEMADQYQRTGLFDGMDVVKTTNGQSGKVVRLLDNETAWVQTNAQAKRGGKAGNPIKIKNLEHSNSTGLSISSPELYSEFKDYALSQTQSRVSSLAPEYIPEWTGDPEVFKRLSPLFDEFMGNKQITDPNIKAALYRDFDLRRTAEYQELGGEFSKIASDVQESVDNLDMQSEPDLYEKAAVKGFRLVPNEQAPGYSLHDNLGDSKHLFNDEKGVETFLSEMPTERLPDLTPSSDVPVETQALRTQNSVHRSPNEDTIKGELVEDMLNEDAERWAPPAQEPEDADVISITPPTESSGGSVGGPPPLQPPGANVGQPEASGPPSGNARALKRAALRSSLDQPGVVQALHDYSQRVFSRYTQPMRVDFANLEDQLFNLGVKDVKPWELFDKIVSGWDQGHNEMFPYHQQVGAQLARIGSQKLRNGSWWKVYEIPDLVERVQEAKRLGFSKDEIGAMGQVDRILTEMHGGGNQVEQLKQYIARVRTAQTSSKVTHDLSYYNQQGFDDIGFFTDHVKDVRARFENVDPATILRQYIRSYGFNKYAGAAWNEAKDTFSMIKNLRTATGEQPYSVLGDAMLDWMDYAQRGPQPGQDMAIRGLRKMLSPIVPLTHQETRRLVQLGMDGMYKAAQGWRIHVVARDMSQPMLAAPTVGVTNLAKAYKTALSFGSEGRAAMLERAYRLGITQKEMPRFEGASMFEASGLDQGVTQFNGYQQAVRGVEGGIASVLRSAVPAPIRAMDMHKLGPLYAYTREGEWNRIITGEAAYQNFMKAHEDWNVARNVAIQSRDLSAIPSSDLLVKAVNGDALHPTIARRISSLIQQDNTEEAAAVYMRGVADRTQFTYGMRHAPAAIRTTAGRMGWAFGNFTTQSLQLAKEFLKYGSVKHKVAVLAMLAAHEGMAEYLDKKTGWNFRQYAWWPSVGFIGSPLLRDASALYGATSGARDAMFSDAGSYAETQGIRTVQKLRGIDIASNLMRSFNPAEGAIYDAKGLGGIMDSPDKMAAAMQFGLTGNTRGAAEQYNQWLSHPQQHPTESRQTQPTVQPASPATGSGETDIMQQMLNYQGSKAKPGGGFY